MLPGIMGNAGSAGIGVGGAPVVGSYDFDGVNDYIELSSTPITAVPCTIMCWMKPDNQATAGLVSIGNSAATSRLQLDRRDLSVNPQDIGAASVNSGGTDQTAFRGQYDTGDWEHCVAVFASTTSRTAYLNGTAGSINTSSNTASGLNSILIGSRYSGGARGAFHNGHIAHVAVWNVALSGAEIMSLAGGANPQSVQLANLVFYAPLANGEAKDIITNTSLTVSGAVSDPTSYPSVASYP